MNPLYTQEDMKNAVKDNIIEEVKLCLEQGLVPTQEDLNNAARNYYTNRSVHIGKCGEMFRMIIETGLKPDQETINIAAVTGYTHLLKICFEYGLSLDDTSEEYILRHMDIDMIKICMEYGFKLTEHIMYRAVMNKNYELFELCLKDGVKPDEKTMKEVSTYIQTDIFKIYNACYV